jgi:hypothetical protein
VLGLPPPDIDLEERGVAVAPLAVLLDPLGDGDALYPWRMILDALELQDDS